MVTWLAPLIVMFLMAAAEWLHVRRMRRIAYLAFGTTGEPRRWVTMSGPLRVLAAGALAWGLLVLIELDAAQWAPSTVGEQGQLPHHVVLALDVSPSMQIQDGGPDRRQTRADRARDVLRSVLSRLNVERTKTSVIAFYTSARPVVVDTVDPEVIDNILSDLPLEHAFSPGKTDLYSAVAAAANVGEKWPRGSATLVVVSDGDTLPTEESPRLSRAFANVVVLGVGDSYRGTFIHDHSSRQDRQSLARLARRFRGTYHDVNQRHLPTDRLHALGMSLPGLDDRSFTRREAAIAAIVVAAPVLAFLPLLLTWAGGAFNPRRAGPVYLDDHEFAARETLGRVCLKT